jgi:hypothetical protein
MVDSLGLSKNVKNILDDWEKQFTYKYVKSDPLKDE